MSNGDFLLKALKKHGGDDVMIPYWEVAAVFPSSEPHPDSFDYKTIDESSLLKWAEEHGWAVSKVPENAPDDARLSPPIRFRKATKVT